MVYWGYNPLTNLLLTSWDIQVVFWLDISPLGISAILVDKLGEIFLELAMGSLLTFESLEETLGVTFWSPFKKIHQKERPFGVTWHVIRLNGGSRYVNTQSSQGAKDPIIWDLWGVAGTKYHRWFHMLHGKSYLLQATFFAAGWETTRNSSAGNRLSQRNFPIFPA